MQDSDWARCLEPALHALIATRCHRAYRHDLTNGLQGIYGGFDALTRLLQLPVRDLAKVERTSDLVRQAITAHEKSLERVLHGLAPLEQPAARIDACAMLQELVKFLINDAAAHRVTLRAPQPTGATVRARPYKLRLILLSLMIDAIDTMTSGGALQANATTTDRDTLLELSDERPGELPVDPWALEFGSVPAHRGWTLFVVRHLVTAEGGSILCEKGATGGRSIRISLPRAQE
jgi:C4-dicarboxylate-specific signal transduction histidine kinase